MTDFEQLRAVDLFAGWGGFSLAAEQAGLRVVLAANPWSLPVEAHQLNHPETAHECQDLRQMDWSSLPEYDVLLASPACQGHSSAGRAARKFSIQANKRHDALRATAWAVVDCAEVTRPRALVVENVPEFRDWDLYDLWTEALRRLGYGLVELVLTASDFGAPQRRRRLFVVGILGADAPSLELTVRDERPIGPCIDWDEGDWRPVSRASSAVQRRIADAQANHGPRCLSQHVSGHRGISLDEPIRTVTTQDGWVVVDGDRYRPLTVRETARAMGFPEEYIWPESAGRRDTIRGLGNAVCPPVARELIAAVAGELAPSAQREVVDVNTGRRVSLPMPADEAQAVVEHLSAVDPNGDYVARLAA